MAHDCGHRCCDERTDPLHDHFLSPNECPPCSSRRAQMLADIDAADEDDR